MVDANDYMQMPNGKWVRKNIGNYSINQTNQHRLGVDEKFLSNPHNLTASLETKELKVFSAHEVINQEGEGVKPLWGSFLSEKCIALLSGEAGVGKTTLGYNLAVCATRGDEFCGIPFGRAMNVLYADLETGDALRKTKLGLISDNNPPDNLYFIPVLDFIGQWEQLKRFVTEQKIDLLFIDTINEAFNTKDEQDNAEANRQFIHIKKLRDETGISTVLMHHIGKGKQARKVYSARGASARAASVDIVLNLLSITEDTMCLQKDKDRVTGGKEKLYLRKAGEDTFEVIEQGEDQEIPLVIRAQHFIMDLLDRGFSHRFEFNEQGKTMGYSEATIGRALDGLVRAAKVTRIRKGIYSKPDNPLKEDLRVVGLEINHQVKPYGEQSEQLIGPRLK